MNLKELVKETKQLGQISLTSSEKTIFASKTAATVK